MLKIAIQKSGRLHEQSLELLHACGLHIDNGLDQLRAEVMGFDAEVYFLRNSDIPGYLEDGVVDLAIIGQNLLAEQSRDVRELMPLGFSRCRLSIAVPRNAAYQNIFSLEGKKIATSYPETVSSYLRQKGVRAEIHEISGSVEIAPNIGLADAICDLVSSGSTLFKNGLTEKEVILKSEACLAANKDSLLEKSELIENLMFRISSVLHARNNRYILFNIPNHKIEEAGKILPVLKSPTVLPLLDKDWSSMHSVIHVNDFWNVIQKLKSIGAQGILIVPIQNMVI
jgi:ATP phosphoribosyltransferase